MQREGLTNEKDKRRREGVIFFLNFFYIGDRNQKSVIITV
jgi:hypothetical protein